MGLATTLATKSQARAGGVLTVGSLFTGCGLLDYGLTLAGLEHRWFAEADLFRRQLLAQRWPGHRIFDDVRAVGADTAERVDVVAGGFPCKGGSTAGKRNGFDHPETALWREMRRVVGELRPRFVVVENVANLLAVRDGAVWAEVLADLASLGFDVVWDCVPAAAFGAPHLRDRVIAVATHADGRDEQRHRSQRGIADGWPDAGGGVAAAPDSPRNAEGRAGEATGAERQRAGVRAGVAVEWGEYEPAIRRWEAVLGRAPEPLVRRVDDRGAMRVERFRLSALGDGVQVQLGELVGRYLMAEVRARATA